MWVLTWLLNIRRISWWIWLVAFVPPLALALHGHLTYSPLQRWLAEWQLEHLTGYYPTLTTAFVGWAATVVWGLPILAVALAVLARRPEAPSGADESNLDRRVALIIAVIVGVIPLVWGGVTWIGAARRGALVEIDAGQLERGDAPAGSYVRLLGKPLHARAVAIKQRGSREWETTSYLPIVSGEWKPGDAIAAMVVGPSWKLEPDSMLGELDPRGTIMRGALGPAASLFEQDGSKLAPNVCVVELGNTPTSDLRKGQVLAALSLPLALFAWFIARRRVSRPGGPETARPGG